MGVTFSFVGEGIEVDEMFKCDFDGDISSLILCGTGVVLIGSGIIGFSFFNFKGLSLMGDSLLSVVCFVSSVGDTTSSLNTSSTSSSVSTPDNPPLPLESVLDL